MLRMYASTSASKAKEYFKIEFNKEGYYSEGQERPGLWGGKGAELLGLSGQVDETRFHQLIDNINPLCGENLTPRTKANRRIGYDFNFNATKSVSLLYAMTGDERILVAFRESIDETMQEMEKEAATRVRKGGADYDRQTGNLIWAEYIHFTSRPTEEDLPCPHLHAHLYTFNATFDSVENQWKAAQFGDLKHDGPGYEAMFHNRLAVLLQDLGYQTEKRGRFFEVVGIEDEMIHRFSRRTQEVEAEAKRLGLTSAKAKDQLGARTRANKMKELSLTDLRESWKKELTPGEYEQFKTLYRDALERVRTGAVIERAEAETDYRNEQVAVEDAIEHCFTHKSAVTSMEILAAAMRFGMGKTDLHRLRKVIAESPYLIPGVVGGHKVFTTYQVLAEERDMVSWVLAGHGRAAPIAPEHKIVDKDLNDEQREAVRHVLESRDWVTGIRGKSGAGKTRVIKEAIIAAAANDKKVFVFAPTARAARETLRKTGFEEAETVQSLFSRRSLQNEVAHQIIWVDEAGLLSARDAVRLKAVAEATRARVILTGDTGQHRAVERGDALRILEQHADLQMATLEKIQRQKGVYKEVMEHLAKGELDQGFDKLVEMNAIHELEDEDRYNVMAKDFVGAMRRKRSVAALAPTHAEIRRVTEAIREELKDKGQIARKGRTFSVLDPITTSPAERKNVQSFMRGQVIEMTADSSSFTRGQRLEVVSREENGLRVRNEHGTERFFSNRLLADRFEVFEPRTIEVCVGDRVQITRIGKTVDEEGQLDSGVVRTVKGFTSKGHLRLNDGLVMDQNYRHFRHGWATTSYAAQGTTVDEVFIAQGNASFGGTSMQGFYVSVGRGAREPHLYVNDIGETLDAVRVSSARVAALDLKPFVPERFVTVAKPAEPRRPRVREVLSAIAVATPLSSGSSLREQLGTLHIETQPETHMAEEIRPMKEQLGTKVKYVPVTTQTPGPEKIYWAKAQSVAMHRRHPVRQLASPAVEGTTKPEIPLATTSTPAPSAPEPTKAQLGVHDERGSQISDPKLREALLKFLPRTEEEETPEMKVEGPKMTM